MKRIFSIILIFICFSSFAVNINTVKVRLMSAKMITTFILSPIVGNYNVYGDGKLLEKCDPSGIYQMSMEGDSIRLKTFEQSIGKFASIKLYAKGSSASYKIKSVVPSSKVRTYDDNLEVSIYRDKKQLLLINNVDLESYIAGVVESESGKKNTLEYYKLQTILCRTFLLAHLNRHETEGFQVCDDVHCQAYLNKATDYTVVEASIETQGLVVVDNDLNLIVAAFFANCGGVTCNSQDVWSLPTSYLKSVKDTFCIHGNAATWHRSIALEDWKSYLQLKHKYPPADSTKVVLPTSFNQDNGRSIYYIDNGLKIPLKTIRNDFKLRSTYFSIEQNGDSIRFNGRGYGHGVGLCQEGAMRMAELHYTYKQIIKFYYKDVHLVDLNTLNYFRQE